MATAGEFEAFYPGAYRRLTGALWVMGVPAAQVDDVAQEAMVRLYGKWDRVARYEHPDAWLRTVAWRIWISTARRRRVAASFRKREEEQAKNQQHSQVPPDQDLVLDVKRALEELPAHHREVVALHYLLDLSVAEISHELGVAEGTIKSRLSRARALLRESQAMKGTV